MTSITARRTMAVLASAVLASSAAVLGVSAPAFADDSYTMSFQPDSWDIEYGTDWYLQVTSNNPGHFAPSWETGTMDITGFPSGYEPQRYFGGSTGTLTPAATSPHLPPGTYTIAAKGSYVQDEPPYGTTLTGSSATPAVIRITPAALDTTVKVVPDASDPTASVITLVFTGDFVDSYRPIGHGGAGGPEGSWTVTISDRDDAVVDTITVDTEPTTPSLGHSIFWAKGTPGASYTATAQFTPTGSSSTNFAIGGPSSFPFTVERSSDEAKPDADVDTPAIQEPDVAGFSVPLWWVILIAVALAALVTLAVVFAVRLGRSPASRVNGGGTGNTSDDVTASARIDSGLDEK